MDALYLLKHSRNDDFEIRQSLRSLERYAPYLRKVWIFGDKPTFISEDTSLIECVPHETVAAVLGVKTPVVNFFLLIFLSSLIPDLSHEYLRMSDDFCLMADFPVEEALKVRYQEDLSLCSGRGGGPWKDSLWRTYDTLKRQGYTGYNFETHTPAYLTRSWVLDAYCVFRDYITEDRHFGLLGLTAILNRAHRVKPMPLINIKEEGSKFGFWGTAPSHEEVVEKSKGRTFFNYDDRAFGEGIKTFLTEKFPVKSKYEK